MWKLYLRLGQVELGRTEFAAARSTGSNTKRHQAYFVLSQARLDEGAGKSNSAATNYQLAFELSRKSRATDLALESIAAWSRLAELTGGPEIALRVIETALPDARQAGRMDIVFNLLLVRARAYAETGKGDLAEKEMNSIRSEAEALGYLTQLMYTLSGLVAVAIERGRWAKGSAFAKQASALAERLGNGLVLGHTLALLCSSEFRQADQGGDQRLIDEALAHGTRSVEVLSRLPPSDSIVLAHGYLTEVYLYRKMGKEATGTLRQSDRICRKAPVGMVERSACRRSGIQACGVRRVIGVGNRLVLGAKAQVS